MKKEDSRKTRNRQAERGSILALSAVGMLSVILAAALAVDVSHLYLAKNELQNAADASALAGASGLNFTPSGIAVASFRAREEFKNQYDFVNNDVQIQPADVRFARNLGDFASGADYSAAQAADPAVAPAIKFVKVQTQQSPIGISFAGSVLGNSFNLWAEAVAGVSVPLNSFTGYLPAFVAEEAGAPTILPGEMYTFRGAPQGSVSPGNYQLLAIDGSGGSDDRDGLASGVRNIVGAGGYVETKPGVTSGAVRQGVNTRFDDYAAGQDPAYYPPDTNIQEDITYAQYLDPNGPKQAPSHPGVANRRVVLIPIVKITELEGGRTIVQIDRFGAFFLRSKVGAGNGGDIQAEYIGTGVVVGNGEYDPTGTTNPGPSIRKPVLYQ
ncbi:MAG TPA: Tad domain-containing protein [Pyrinomonadaceae bacterium]|nr:Tad domain-containing protein [Pyrinomonadaceae bacterium]